MISTTITLSLASGSNPSTYGSSVTFLATIQAASGTVLMSGKVTFLDAGEVIGSASIASWNSTTHVGKAGLSIDTLKTGAHNITASYSGDSNYSTSSTSTALPQTVDKCTPMATNILTNPGSTSVYGQPVKLTGAVASPGTGLLLPTGVIDYYDSTTPIGSATIAAITGPPGSAGSSLSYSGLAVGSHSLKGTYSGDNNYTTANNGPASFTVDKANTTTTLSSSVNPSAECQNVVFTAQVQAVSPGSGTPTGTITFKNSGVTMGTASLSGGVATYSTSTLSMGSKSITADYGGDGNFNTSSSGTLTQTVNAAVDWVLDAAAVVAPDPVQSNFLPFGGAEFSPLSGALLQSLAIDANQHETCGCGCGCAKDNCQSGITPLKLVHNSGTINVQPIIQATLASDFCSSVPTQIQAQLTFNGTAQATVTYDTTGHSAGDVYPLPLQVDSPVSSSGIYPWSVEVWATVGTFVYDRTVSGVVPVVENSSSPFGAGKSLGGTQSLIIGAAGVAIVDNTTAGARYFTGSAGTLPFTYTSPANDQGTLIQNVGGTFTYTAKNQVQTNFDSSGNQTSQVDPHGLTQTLNYTSGLLTSIQQPDGGVATFSYSSGLLASVEQPGGLFLTISYDAFNNMTGSEDAASGLYTFAYDTNNRLINQQVGPLNVTYSYSATNGTLSQIDRGLGTTLDITPSTVQGLGVATAVFDSQAVAAVTDALGNITSMTLDPLGRLTQLQTADGALQTWVLDAAGNPTSYIDQLGRTTTNTFNASEDLVQVQYPDGTFATYQYDSTFHVVKQIQDALNHFTTMTHDATTGDLLTKKDALGNVTTYTWSNGLMLTLEDALGRVTTNTWNSSTRQETAEINALGFATSYGYDTAGNKISVQDALGNITTSSFDGNRRLLTTTDALGGVGTMMYDAVGNVTSSVDQLGRVSDYSYDMRGLRSSTTEAVGTAQQRTTTNSYDVAANLLYQTDPNSDLTSYAYDALNRRIAQLDAYGTSLQRATTTLFDPVGNVISGIDAKGTATSYAYDVRNRQVQTIEAYGDALQRTTSTSYDTMGNVFNVTDPNLTVTSFGYDALYRQIQRIEAYGLSGLQRTTTTNYDAVSNTVSVENPIGAITSFGYDALYRQVQTIEAQGSGVARTTTTNYDPVGNTLSVENPRGVTTSFGYDELYRRVTALMAYGTGLQYAVTTVFDAVSNTLSVTNGLNVTTSFGYDALNRRVNQLDAYGTGLQRTTTTVLDADDNVIATIDPLGFATTMGYDDLNRQTSVTDPGGGIATTIYDPNNNVVNSIDQLGNTGTYVYDVFNRKTQTIDALGGVVTQAYDPNNNLLSLTDPVGNQTQWNYDALNRKTQEMDPLSNVGTYAYDALDRLTSSTDKLGQRIARNYDLLNRETSESWYNSSSSFVSALTYTFDANNNMLTQSFPVSGVAMATTMTYDSLDRLSTQKDSFGTLLTNTYDTASNRIQTQDSFGGITTRTFDALNRMTTLGYTGQSTALREDYAYTVRDQVAGQTRYTDLAGTTTIGYSTMTYDSVYRLTNLQHMDGSFTNIANFTNTYDEASRITSEVLNGSAPTTYQYDKTNQLTNDSAVTYTFDLNGNRTMTGYTTGPANEITSDGTWNYYTDKNGNIVQRTNISTGEVVAYTFDVGNRMVGVTDTTTSGLQTQGTYVYDALNQRVEKNVWTGGIATITEFAYDDRQIWADLNSSNALQTRYMRTDNVLELPATVSSGGSVAWLLPDRMGSIRNVVNSSGTVIDTILYDGFGNILSESSPANGGLYKAFGYRFDSETGMLRSDGSTRRYYLVWIGRFDSFDPILFGAGDPNPWRYCGNDPMQSVDFLATIECTLSAKVGGKDCDFGKLVVPDLFFHRGEKEPPNDVPENEHFGVGIRIYFLEPEGGAKKCADCCKKFKWIQVTESWFPKGNYRLRKDTHVDNFKGNKHMTDSPFYGDGNPNRVGPPLEIIGFPPEDEPRFKKAKRALYDRPFKPDREILEGLAFKWTAHTCLVCVRRPAKPDLVVGCVKWGFTRMKGGQAKIEPKPACEETSDVKGLFQDALDRNNFGLAYKKDKDYVFED